MIKFLVFLVITLALIVGCKRLGWETGSPTPDDGLTAVQYNWRLLAGYAWPVLLPLVRFIPGIGGPLQELLANVSWSTLATKKQKEADA